jgi:DNA-binding CsgD family transcriptional regulator
MCVLKQPHLPVAARVPALVVLGRIQTRRGDPNSETLLDEARDLALATGEVQRIAPVTVARAERAWLQGDREQCLAECRGGYDLAVKHGHPWLLGELSIWMWRAGEVSFTSQTVAEPFARQMAGDWRGSAELWARLGCPYEQALALAEGDVSAQFEALTLFEQLGALSAAALVRRQLRRKRIVGIPRGVIHSTRANQAGLTNRQMEVFRLMAQGLSNAEIATRLFTSPKTIENHAAAIFAKLGVRSRAQVIRIAQQESIVPNDQSAVP